MDGDNALVIALWPARNERRVIAGGGNGAIRAAVSVAVAAGNTRPWTDVAGDSPVEFPVETLPEIIRTAAVPSNIRSLNVAVVRTGTAADTTGEPACVAMWFTTTVGANAAVSNDRREAIGLLSAAADRDVARVALAAQQADLADLAAAEAAAAAPPPVAESSATGHATDDPNVDPTTGVASRRRFDRELDDMNVDEATLVLFSLDAVDALNDEHGLGATDEVRRIVAARLVQGCRRTDIVARLDADTFAVLLLDVDRRTAFEVSRRLRASISEPLRTGDGTGPESITASVGLAHQVGLVDATDLFDTASSAMHEARQSGGAKMLVGS